MGLNRKERIHSMPAQERKITKADIAPFDVYVADRAMRKRALVAIKKPRRIEVGPFATFYFENYDQIWQETRNAP